MINTCKVCKLDIIQGEKHIIISQVIADHDRFEGYIKTFMVTDIFCHIDCIDKQLTGGK